MFSKKGVLKNLAKLTKKDLCPSPTLVFYCQFYEIFENNFFTEHFRAKRLDEEALVKNFNSVSLIFLNSGLYHAPPE